METQIKNPLFIALLRLEQNYRGFPWEPGLPKIRRFIMNGLRLALEGAGFGDRENEEKR
jgi:hypothetical protein